MKKADFRAVSTKQKKEIDDLKEENEKKEQENQQNL